MFVAGALGWLLLGFGGLPAGVRPLADNPTARIEFFENVPDMTINDIIALPNERWEVLKPGRKLIYFYRQQSIWLRLTLKNETDHALHGVMSHGDIFLDQLESWSIDSADKAEPIDRWRHEVSGEIYPITERALWGRDIALPISVLARGETTVYVRAFDHFGLGLLPVWWPNQTEFTGAQARSLLAEGAYFGLLVGLLGYNLMLWLRLRLPDIFYYSLYLFSVAWFMALARGMPSLLGWTLASPPLEALIAMTMVLSGVFLVQFARVFLDFKTRQPRVDRLARVMMAGLLVIAACALSGLWIADVSWMRTAVLGVGVSHVTLLLLSLWAWQRGIRQARFFSAAFGCLFAATIPVVVLWLGNNFVGAKTMMFLMIGSALEMLLLSLATADRFAQAQREKVDAQEKLIEETEQRRAIQEAYADELAVEVRERTRDLEDANTDKDRMIAVIGHDLRSPLTSLTQTAEQLARTPEDTASLLKFARDSGQVGRQTLLLIEDLVLWARLRAGLRQPSTKHPVRALVAPVIALHRAFAGQRGIELAVEGPETLRISTDLVLAQTLLRNLVANALKFACNRVLVSARQEEGGVRITVSDDGTGLPAKVLAALTKENAAIDNSESGLGLRLCMEIARVLQTKLVVVASTQQGTEFQFILPAAGSDSTPPV